MTPNTIHYHRNRDRICAERKATYRANPEPHKLRAREWAKNNPEKVKTRTLRYNSARRLENSEKARTYYYTNHEICLIKNAAYRARHRERNRAASRKRSSEVTDGYAREQLSKYTPVSASFWPQWLVDLKKQHIKLKRIVKQHEKHNRIANGSL